MYLKAVVTRIHIVALEFVSEVILKFQNWYLYSKLENKIFYHLSNRYTS